MNPCDLVKIRLRIPGKDVRPVDDIGIIIGTIRKEMHGPPDYLVMWSSKEFTISRGYHLQLIKVP